jgi:superfamily I DNA/RNA helicase
LKLLDNYHEPLAFYRAFDLPKFRISQDELSTITRYAHQKTLTLYEALKNEELRSRLQDQSKTALDKLLGLLEEHSKKAGRKSAVLRICINNCIKRFHAVCNVSGLNKPQKKKYRINNTFRIQ